jgi:hydrogenase-4 membrane subunit HyfE
MDFIAPETSSRLITLLASLMVVLQLLLVAQRMLLTNIRLFALQSLVLSLIALVVAVAYGAWHVLVVAVLTVIGKVVILPWLLRRLVQRTQVEQGARPYLNMPASMFICGALTLMAFVIARPFTSLERLGSNTLGVALMLLFTGFFLMINRRTAITQVLGLLTTENGVMLAAIALTTYGMPLVVELAIFIDVVAAVVVLGLLVLRIRESYNSTDVSKLSELKG